MLESRRKIYKTCRGISKVGTLGSFTSRLTHCLYNLYGTHRTLILWG